MAIKEKEKIRIQRQTAYEKIRNGEKDITYSDCLLAVNYDGQIISSITSDFITEEICIAALKNNDSNKNLIKYIPDNILTENLAISIVSINGGYLRYLPENLISEEVCLAALEHNYSNSNLIKYIPQNILTKKFAISVVTKNGRYLKYLPLDVVTKSVVLQAVKQTIHAIEYIPDKYKTEDVYISLFDITPKILKYLPMPSTSLCEYAMSQKPSAIAYIKDISILTDEMYKKAVSSDWKSLKYIPAPKITKELCEYAFNANYKAFKLFPDEYKTLEWCENVIQKDAAFLQYCPTSIISLKMCESCVEQRGVSLEFVPDIFKTEHICLLAIEQDCKAFNFIPHRLLTNEFFIKCLDQNLDTIRFLPDEYKTPDIYKALLEKTSFSKSFKDWLTWGESYYPGNDRNYEKYIALKKLSQTTIFTNINTNILELERKLLLRKTISSFYDSEISSFTINEQLFKTPLKTDISNFEDYYAYLNGNLQGADLTEFDFEGIDVSLYNLDGAYLCGKLLMEQGNYNGEFYDSYIGQYSEEVSLLPVLSNETMEARLISHAEFYNEKLNSCDRKIFYITDLHLNHRLIDKFPQYASFDAIRLFIEKYVNKMIKTARGKGYEDYLLIGGDVSFCFDISKMFYTELCKHWAPSKIIVVLGNHELWDFNRFGAKVSSNSIDDIIENYRLLFSELGITFLQNSLLLRKQFSSSVISEKDILEKSIDELRSLALDSNLIVFGGIGFSAYNETFNATNGIYRNAITSLESDLQHTRQSERIYNKLWEAFSKDKVIVLSHMPPRDWAKRDLVPNWIYVNGHTHSNHYIQSDECTVLADNQMGYTSKSIGLKYFKASCLYDTFKYYSDGIHHITKSQYMEFNVGNRTSCTFNRDVDYIIMLKRQEMYLFLLEDKERDKLFLLNGGVTNRLKENDVNYYYENMLKYSEHIKLSMKKYNNALKSIADTVKKIGGDGTIHGCIVDISFFNHIYLNPEDGSISAYYSPWFGDRYEYPTVENLLENRLPLLYANYKKLIGNSTNLVVMSNVDITSDESMHILDTTQYKPSRLIKRLQYITESNVIRIWNDDFILNHEQHISENKKLLT